MFGLSFSHILMLAMIILLFGARRLPALGFSLGASIGAFKRGLEGKDEDKELLENQTAENKSAAGTHKNA